MSLTPRVCICCRVSNLWQLLSWRSSSIPFYGRLFCCHSCRVAFGVRPVLVLTFVLYTNACLLVVVVLTATYCAGSLVQATRDEDQPLHAYPARLPRLHDVSDHLFWRLEMDRLPHPCKAVPVGGGRLASIDAWRGFKQRKHEEGLLHILLACTYTQHDYIISVLRSLVTGGVFPWLSFYYSGTFCLPIFVSRRIFVLDRWAKCMQHDGSALPIPKAFSWQIISVHFLSNSSRKHIHGQYRIL